METLLHRLAAGGEPPEFLVNDVHKSRAFIREVSGGSAIAAVRAIVDVTPPHIFIQTLVPNYAALSLQFDVDGAATADEVLEKVANMDPADILALSGIKREYSADAARGRLYDMLRPDLLPGRDLDAGKVDTWVHVAKFVNRATRGQDGEEPLWDDAQIHRMIFYGDLGPTGNDRQWLFDQLLDVMPLETPAAFRNVMAFFNHEIDAPMAAVHVLQQADIGNAILLRRLCPKVKPYFTASPAETSAPAPGV